ncbi:MAG: peptide deformylase [Geminicoccaceae bacterium]
MALLKIARMGHPVLWQKAAVVDDPDAPAVQRLVDHMIDTLADADGVGLAAPQVHVSKRIVLVHPDRTETGGSPDVLINPELVFVDDAMELGLEGCLSIPGLRGVVPRHARLTYRALNRQGQPIEGEALGFHARVLQHEVDHLDGVLYLNRMTDLSLLAFDSELKHLVAALQPAPGGHDREETS